MKIGLEIFNQFVSWCYFAISTRRSLFTKNWIRQVISMVCHYKKCSLAVRSVHPRTTPSQFIFTVLEYTAACLLLIRYYTLLHPGMFMSSLAEGDLWAGRNKVLNPRQKWSRRGGWIFYQPLGNHKTVACQHLLLYIRVWPEIGVVSKTIRIAKN
jgi:hypothetical protein